MLTTRKAWAFFRRDLLIDLSYKLSFALQVVDLLMGIASFFFLARMIGPGSYRTYEPFSFILIGMAVNGYMTTSLACFSQAVRGNQPIGTLKAVLVTPTSPLGLILLSSSYPFARAAFDAGLYLVAGMMFGLSLGRMNIIGMLVLFLLSVLVFSSIGVLSATFTLIFKRGDPLLWLFGGLSWLIGGVFYPIEVLPGFLRYAAQLLPLTHVLQGMRAAILSGASTRQLLPQIGILALFALFGVPLSLAAFHFGMRRARSAGTLSHY
jgi:ABC-2 type transport system permease protein